MLNFAQILKINVSQAFHNPKLSHNKSKLLNFIPDMQQLDYLFSFCMSDSFVPRKALVTLTCLLKQNADLVPL